MANVTTKQPDKQWLTSMGIDESSLPAGATDWRLITNGFTIPSKGYSDQPYIVKTDDGAWLCVMTTGAGHEGEGGQHIISQRSCDNGVSWSDFVEIESPQGPEASYAVLLKAPSGRIYCFYNYNLDNVRKVRAERSAYPDGYCRRVDSMGYFVFKYSDDHGRTWSAKRHIIYVREMRIDRENPYQGEIRFFWNVGKAFSEGGRGYVPLHKVCGFGLGFFTRTEGVLLESDNILTETDPEKIRWETLPDGEDGLKTPPGGGLIAEEQSVSVMSDGSFFCVYRSVDGHPVCSYSRDGGHSWSQPQYMTYTVGGRPIKHPRAANFVWKCSNGKYLYWFHNHGGRDYNDRNPVWMCCGIETRTPKGLQIEWSLPEVLLYSDDPFTRMSYPDLVEDGGEFFMTETQKSIARVHRIDPEFIERLMDWHSRPTIVEKGLVLDVTSTGKLPLDVVMPQLPEFVARDSNSLECRTEELRKGVTIDMWFKLNSHEAGQVLLDNTDLSGKGFIVRSAERGTLEIILDDGRCRSSWCSDPMLLDCSNAHHAVIIIDGGPKIISFIIDGQFCDGGRCRQFGWGRFNPNLRNINGIERLFIAPDIDGYVRSVRIYNRAIMTNEAAANHMAGNPDDFIS